MVKLSSQWPGNWPGNFTMIFGANVVLQDRLRVWEHWLSIRPFSTILTCFFLNIHGVQIGISFTQE
jgi:hypothetical protein